MTEQEQLKRSAAEVPSVYLLLGGQDNGERPLFIGKKAGQKAEGTGISFVAVNFFDRTIVLMEFYEKLWITGYRFG
jgi:hypothetical protein